MNKPTEKTIPEVKTGNIKQACQRYGLGATKMREVAKEAHAVIKIGACFLVNFTKMDEYLDSLTM